MEHDNTTRREIQAMTVSGGVAPAALVQGNPLGLAIGSVVAGFLLGALVPVSVLERERIGPYRDKLTESVKVAAMGLVDQSKAAVAQAVSESLFKK